MSPTLLTPAQLIQNLLQNATPQLRAQVLERAKTANEQRLYQLEEEHMAASERGWEDHWKERYTRTENTLAEIKRALATC